MNIPAAVAPTTTVASPLVLHFNAESLPKCLADLLISPSETQSHSTSTVPSDNRIPNRQYDSNRSAAASANKAKEPRRYQKILPNPAQVAEMELEQQRRNIDEVSLIADIGRKKEGLKSSPQFFEIRQRLERAKMGDFLKHKMQNRPDKKELVSQRILLDNGGVEPGIGEKLALLKKYRLTEALNDKLAHRPGPLELVRGNILQVNGDLEQAVKEGQVMFRPTSTGVSDESDGAFDASGRCPGGGKARKVNKPVKFHEYKGPRSSPRGGATSSPVSPPVCMVSTAGGTLPVPGISHCSDSPTPTPSPSCSIDGPDSNIDPRLAARSAVQSNCSDAQQCNGLTTSVTACFGPEETSPVPPGLQNMIDGADSSTSYELLLQQQQVLLQWQLELQQKYPNTCHGAETPKYATSPADCSAMNSPDPQNGSLSFDNSLSVQSTPKQQTDQQQHHSTSMQHPQPTGKEHAAKPSRSGSSKSRSSGGGGPGSQPFKPPTRLEDMRVCDLKAECKKRNLAVSGPKPNLVERLRSHEPTILADFAESHRARESSGDAADTACCAGSLSKPDRSSSVASLPHIQDVTSVLGGHGEGDGVDCETRTGGGTVIPCSVADEEPAEHHFVRGGMEPPAPPVRFQQQQQQGQGGEDGHIFMTHSGQGDPTGLNGDLFSSTFDSSASFACPPEDFFHSADSSANQHGDTGNNMVGYSTFGDVSLTEDFFGSAGQLPRQNMDLTPPAQGHAPMGMTDTEDAFVFSDSFAIDNGVDHMSETQPGLSQGMNGLASCSPMLDAHRFNGSSTMRIRCRNPVPMLTSTMLSMHEDLLRQQQTRIDELQRSLRRSQEQLKKQQQLILAAKHMQTTSNDDGSGGEAKQMASANDFLLNLDTKQIQKLHIQLFLQHKVQQQRMQAQVRCQEELMRGLELLREEFAQQQSTRELAHLLRLEPRLAQTIIRLLKRERQMLLQQRNGKPPVAQCTPATGQVSAPSRQSHSQHSTAPKSRNSSTSRKQSQHSNLAKSSSMPTSPQKSAAAAHGPPGQMRQVCAAPPPVSRSGSNMQTAGEAGNNAHVDMEEIFNNVISIAATMSTTAPPPLSSDQQPCGGELQPPTQDHQDFAQGSQKKPKRKSSSKRVVVPTSDEGQLQTNVASPAYLSASLAPTPDHSVKMDDVSDFSLIPAGLLDGSAMDSGSLLDQTSGFGDIMDMIQQQNQTSQQGVKLDQYPNTFGDGLNFGCWPEFNAFDDCHLNTALLGNSIPPPCLGNGGAQGPSRGQPEEQMDWLDLILPSPSGTDGTLPSDPASSSTPPSLGTLASPPRPIRTGTHDPILSGTSADDPGTSFDIMHMVDVIQKTPAEELCV